MSFIAQNDRIYITNSSNTLMFDTNWKMPAITNVVSGSYYLPYRGYTGIVTNNYDLGGVSYNPEFVLISASITGAASYPWANTKFNSSGSILTNLSWQYSGGWILSGSRTITFYTENNRLYLKEKYYNYNGSLNLSAFTISYTAYLGSFV